MGRRPAARGPGAADAMRVLELVNTQREELEAARRRLVSDRDRDGPVCRRPADAVRDRTDWRVGVGDRDLRLATDPEPPAIRRLGGLGTSAVSERQNGPRSRHYTCRQ